MKRLISLLLILIYVHSIGQDNVLPAPKQTKTIVITNAIVHVGNGQVLNNASIEIVDGKIASVGNSVNTNGATVIDASGKHVYPGLILPVSSLGLIEVSAVRATNDLTELGELNPNIRSLAAYNTDSRVINTLRSNGILLANIVPQGGILSGQSSVVQLDAWNWEDAAYKTDNGIHFYMPALRQRQLLSTSDNSPRQPQEDPVKRDLDQVDRMKTFLNEAKAYSALKSRDQTNLKFNAVKGLFDKSKKLYVHANTVKQMLVALDFVKEFDFDVVIVGGADSWQIADLLKQHNVSVILQHPHTLPVMEDDDIDQPFKTATLLKKAGVLFAISDDDGQTRGRNLPFNAGTTATYGLTREEALQAITLNAAKVLGIDDKTGSIEAGKDANIIISHGDILDMRTSIVTDAFIQGRKIDLTDKHKQLYDRYNKKYDLRPFSF